MLKMELGDYLVTLNVYCKAFKDEGCQLDSGGRVDDSVRLMVSRCLRCMAQ